LSSLSPDHPSALRHPPFPIIHSPLSVIPSEAEGSAVSLSLASEAQEKNCRSLGFARDDRKGRVDLKETVVTKETW
jgi:hypothetical protein